MAAMRSGDFEKAWKISDSVLAKRIASRLDCASWPRHLQYIWTGEALAGKHVLVRCYHGLGDTIHYIRFASPLREVARKVTVWVQPALLSLIATAAGVDDVLPLHEGTPDLAYDVDVEIMELPHALRTSRRSLPTTVPYLFPPTSPQGLDQLSPVTPRVGVVWQAGDWAPHRSIPSARIGELSRASGIRLCSLQRGVARRDAHRVTAIDLSSDDILQTAAVVRQMDLVISVDSMMAHLAGALGVPIWTLLHHDCDWRWMDQGQTSIWYPSMRLFRQPCAGDWSAVLDDVRSALLERFGLLQ